VLVVCRRLGKDNFPVIEQTLYGNHREMLITPDFPIVGKVGHAHAGTPTHLVSLRPTTWL
jgi:hypothetical protein